MAITYEDLEQRWNERYGRTGRGRECFLVHDLSLGSWERIYLVLRDVRTLTDIENRWCAQGCGRVYTDDDALTLLRRI